MTFRQLKCPAGEGELLLDGSNVQILRRFQGIYPAIDESLVGLLNRLIVLGYRLVIPLTDNYNKRNKY